jgi:predicted dehydrogenase
VRTLHWPVLKRLRSRIRVVAIASRGSEKAQELANLTGGARVYPDYHDLLADANVDAVLTAVPIASNARVLMDSISAAKHVIAEKPLAATAAEGRQVLKACAATSKVVLIAENYRYRPDLFKAREIIHSGVIGDIFAFQLAVKFDVDAATRKIWTDRSWRREGEHPGGFLLDRNPLMKGPDGLLMQLKLDNGVAGQYFALYTAKIRHETLLHLSIYGSLGTLELNTGTLEWSRGPEAGERIRIPRSDRGYVGQWLNFIDAIQGRAPVVSTPERALGDVAVIAAALRSASEGKPVHVRALD